MVGFVGKKKKTEEVFMMERGEERETKVKASNDERKIIYFKIKSVNVNYSNLPHFKICFNKKLLVFGEVYISLQNKKIILHDYMFIFHPNNSP